MAEYRVCTVCGFASKRKSNLLVHVKQKHHIMNPEERLGPLQYHENRNYINPHHFKKEIVLGGFKQDRSVLF